MDVDETVPSMASPEPDAPGDAAAESAERCFPESKGFAIGS